MYKEIFEGYFDEAKDNVGEYTSDKVPCGDTDCDSGEYLINEYECRLEALNNIKKDWEKIKEDYEIHPLVSFHCFRLEV